MARRVKYQLLRNYFYYNTQELVSVLGVSKSTVQNWVRSGLKSIKSANKGPYFFGMDVKECHKLRNRNSKVKLLKGEVFCGGCKQASKLKTSSIKLMVTDKLLGNKGASQIIISGRCRTCGSKCNLFSSSNRVSEFLAKYPKYSNKNVRFKQATETVQDLGELGVLSLKRKKDAKHVQY